MILVLLLLLLWPHPAIAHDDLNWAGKFRSAGNIPCCTGDHDTGDCTRIAVQYASTLGYGSKVMIEYPGGRALTVVDSIYESEDRMAVICKPGCLFRHTGV